MKLTIGVAALLGVTLAVGFGSVQMIERLSGSLTSALDVTAKKVDLAAGMRSGVRDMRLHAALAEISLINGTVVHHVNTGGAEMVCADCHTTEKSGENRELFTAVAGELKKQAAVLRSLPLTASESAALSAMEDGVRRWPPLYAEYFGLAEAHNFGAAHDVMMGKIYPIVADVEKQADLLRAEEDQAMAAARSAARRQASSSVWRASGAVALCGLIGCAVLLLVRRTTRILRQSAGEIAEMIREVASATSQIAASSEALAQSASEQTSSLEVAGSSSEWIRSAARQNTEHAGAASGRANGVVEEMRRANQTLEEATRTMQEIDASGSRVTEIVRMIDEIAFQTKLLALNAAIEAARAGSAGMGFAVVADEVGTLAERSATAARDTAAIVEESVAKSSEGKVRLETLGDSIRTITGLSGDIHAQIGEVASASEEQSRSVANMADAIAEMQQVTQSISACAEENAATAQELSAQAQHLEGVGARLEQLVG